MPETFSPAVQAFFGRLCEERVRGEAEEWFQRARSELKYKRKELTLEVTSPGAVLTAKDFTFELSYELKAGDPTSFVGTQVLHDMEVGCLGRAEFEELFAGQFSEIVFELTKGVSVEAVIDAVEDLNGARGMSVEYPSDCSSCTIAVEGVEAQVECDGLSLKMIFPRAGGPSELVDAFVAVRQAFALSKRPVLAGLL